MKKNTGKKSILKEAGALLISVILVLTSLFIPTIVAQKQGHDVGVTEIISPTNGPIQSYTPEVNVKNFGIYVENSVTVEMVIEKNGVTDYYQMIYVSTISPGESLSVTFPSWYPSDIGKFNVTACTQLSGDENSSNDCFSKTFYITMDFMGLGVAPLGLAELEIIENKLQVSNCVSGQNDTDGFWTNLENSYNQYEVSIETPQINAKTSQTFSTINNYGINEEGIKIMKSPEYYSWLLFTFWTEPLDTATVEAYKNHVLVFQKEHIPAQIIGDERKLEYGRADFSTRVNFHFGSSGSLGVRFSEVIKWTWTEQGVNSIDVNFIKVIPENRTGTIVFSYNSLYENGITEFNITGVYAWTNYPPNEPTIEGQTNGKIIVEYEYTFNALDPDGDDVYYYVDWGDDTNSSWLGPYASGVPASATHKWTKKGTYIIKVKAKDITGDESDWTTLEVIMPKTRMINQPFQLLKLLFERFPNMFPLMRYLMWLYP